MKRFRTFSVLMVVGLIGAACNAGGGSSANELSVIALPRDWCNYDGMLKGFAAKYPDIKINEITPNAGSGDEVTAVKNSKGNTGAGAPDVIDVGVSFGPQAKTDGLLANYKVPTWDTIDPTTKDADGAWYGDYYGVLSFEVNTDIVKTVPKDWKDLLNPEYAHSVALAGDPLNSNQAIQTIEAASIANGGTVDDAQPGLAFFKQLETAGNFVHTVAKKAALVKGEAPIIITWSYLALADRDSLAGSTNVTVVIPATGRWGGLYAQGISAYAPHLANAKKWEDYLYSDEGQLNWLKGYCSTTRQADLIKNNKIPADLLAKLPDVTGAVFPTEAQLTAAKTLIQKSWSSVVGVGPLNTPPP